MFSGLPKVGAEATKEKTPEKAADAQKDDEYVEEHEVVEIDGWKAEITLDVKEKVDTGEEEEEELYAQRSKLFRMRDGEEQRRAEHEAHIERVGAVEANRRRNLEKAREGQIINFKARLVGNDGLLSSNGANIQKGKDTTPRISSDGKIRCNNCPTRGCYDCPMFGVGRDPEFRRRQRKVSARRKEQQRKYAAEENNQREIDL